MSNVTAVDLPLVTGPVAAWLAAYACDATDSIAAAAACRRASGADDLAGPAGGRTTWEQIAEAATGATVKLLLPDHGDPAGLGGLWDGEPGERVLILSSSRGPSVYLIRPDPIWRCQVVAAPIDPAVHLLGENPPEAARALVVALREATDVLTALGLDRPVPQIREDLERLEQLLAQQCLPPGLRHPERISQASRMLLIARLALNDSGAAVTAHEVTARSAPVRALAYAARRAIAAAYVDVDTVRV